MLYEAQSSFMPIAISKAEAEHPHNSHFPPRVKNVIEEAAEDEKNKVTDKPTNERKNSNKTQTSDLGVFNTSFVDKEELDPNFNNKESQDCSKDNSDETIQYHPSQMFHCTCQGNKKTSNETQMKCQEETKDVSDTIQINSPATTQRTLQNKKTSTLEDINPSDDTIQINSPATTQRTSLQNKKTSTLEDINPGDDTIQAPLDNEYKIAKKNCEN